MRRVALLSAACLLLAAAPTRGEDCVVIEDFAGAKVGAFPAGWQVRKDAGRSVYTVQEEDGRRFLRAASKGHGIQAAKEFAWDVSRYPVLAWSWRPREFPPGADEKDGRNDSVLSVYFMVSYSRIRGPKTVKYIWSEHVPVGTRLQSNGGLTQVRVLETGTQKRGEWVEERVKVLDDYRAYFEEKDAPTPAGVAVLTDSDDTGSRAEGDYAKLRACRE